MPSVWLKQAPANAALAGPCHALMPVGSERRRPLSASSAAAMPAIAEAMLRTPPGSPGGTVMPAKLSLTGWRWRRRSRVVRGRREQVEAEPADGARVRGQAAGPVLGPGLQGGHR